MGISISMCFEFRVIEVKPDAFCLASIPCPSETGIPPFDQARSHLNRWSSAAAAKRPCMNIKCVCEGQDSRLRMLKLFSIPSFRADGERGSTGLGTTQLQIWQSISPGPAQHLWVSFAVQAFTWPSMFSNTASFSRGIKSLRLCWALCRPWVCILWCHGTNPSSSPFVCASPEGGLFFFSFLLFAVQWRNGLHSLERPQGWLYRHNVCSLLLPCSTQERVLTPLHSQCLCVRREGPWAHLALPTDIGMVWRNPHKPKGQSPDGTACRSHCLSSLHGYRHDGEDFCCFLTLYKFFCFTFLMYKNTSDFFRRPQGWESASLYSC